MTEEIKLLRTKLMIAELDAAKVFLAEIGPELREAIRLCKCLDCVSSKRVEEILQRQLNKAEALGEP